MKHRKYITRGQWDYILSRFWCSSVSCAELNFAKKSKAVKVIDLHQCRCQNMYKRALHYALVSSLDVRAVIPCMNILLGRTIVDKFIEC
jgi:hypothetical protein